MLRLITNLQAPSQWSHYEHEGFKKASNKDELEKVI
jgi:hypothetical protein